MLTPAGRINKLFGTDGGLMLTLYPAFPEDFNTATPLMVSIDALDVPIYCDRFERRGQTGAVATFADFDTERRASELIGREFRIDLEEEEDDEFYMEDLIGFVVEARENDSETKHRGKLTDYYDNEANPLFELEIESRKILIPAVEDFIAHIDFKRRAIRFVLPEGLLNLE